jgi:hypothetical protein
MILGENGQWHSLITTNVIPTEYLGDHSEYENHPLATGLVYTAKEYMRERRK